MAEAAPLDALAHGAAVGGVLGFSGTMLSLLELEIEGERPWAVGLPTWRRECWPFGAGKTPVTGYHLSLFAFTISLLAAGVCAGTWTHGHALHAGEPLRVVSFLMLLFIAEDGGYFFVTPHAVPFGSHFGGVFGWTRRFGGSAVAGVALATLAALADAWADGAIAAEEAAASGAAAGAGALLGVLAWLPLSALLLRPLYKYVRDTLDPRTVPWKDLNAVGALPSLSGLGS